MDKKEEILYELIQCLLTCKNYEAAYIFNQIALDKFPKVEHFHDLKDTISAFIDLTETQKILERNLDVIKVEYEEEKLRIQKNK